MDVAVSIKAFKTSYLNLLVDFPIFGGDFHQERFFKIKKYTTPHFNAKNKHLSSFI